MGRKNYMVSEPRFYINSKSLCMKTCLLLRIKKNCLICFTGKPLLKICYICWTISNSAIIETAYFFHFVVPIMYGCPQEPWQNQSVFVATPRQESLCELDIAIVKVLLQMLDKINALVRHFVWRGVGLRSLICITYASG